MYVSVKGGEKAINNAHSWLSEIRRGDVNIAELNIKQISEQLTLSVDRVMSEGSLYDKDLSALAIKQSRGDLIEAIFLMRAYRTTLPRIGSSKPIETSKMLCLRRISATFKDIPGKQKLGPTFDYTHRLLDFKLLADGEYEKAKIEKYDDKEIPHVLSFLNKEGLIQKEIPSGKTSKDITRNPINFPLTRSERLQSLSRGDEGFLLGLAYSTQRGYARNHAFVGELRTGYVEVQFEIPELGIEINIADVMFTECESVNQFKGSKKIPAQFTRGYGLVFGQLERKAISMALVDRSMRWKEFGEEYLGVAAQDEEFVISHCDNIQATGFLEHIKLPHYVDFQAELDLVRKIREEYKKMNNVLKFKNKKTDVAAQDEIYNFAYLDENTKRMIRRALIKALCIPGYQVPFSSREMPMPYGWGTGGVQVTSSCLTTDDVIKVIDQGADDTTNAVSIRNFFKKTANIETTEKTSQASIIQTRHRIPEEKLKEKQILVYQVPIPEPLAFLEPRYQETKKMHALSEYGIMHVKLYEDITKNGHIETAYAYPVKTNERYIMDPSPIPKFDNPKMNNNPAIQLFGAGREQRIYAIPPYTEVTSLDFEDYPFDPSKAPHKCSICGSNESFLDEIITDDDGNRSFICSDTNYCNQRMENN